MSCSTDCIIEYGYTSLNKLGEELCGDNVETVRGDDGSMTMVLADGLGSGVKANILSTLTAKIMSTMVAAEMPMQDCVETMIDTLPICRVRGVAYSTFSVVHLSADGRGYLVEFDNPQAIYIVGGRCRDFERKPMEVCGKTIYYSDLALRPGDTVVLMSDGAIYAGVGQLLNFGWQRNDIMEYVDRNLEPQLSARCIAWIVASACNELYDNRPGDDTTVAALRYRQPLHASLMVGPPVDKADDREWVGRFMASPGKKIVSGGTTSQIVSRTLGATLSTTFEFPDREIPPIGHIDGIDLTTEGTITLRRVLNFSEHYLSSSDLNSKTFDRTDGASLIAEILFEQATDIDFFVGQGVNKAHDGLPINIKMKLKLIESLADNLRRMGKQVNIFYA